MEFGALVRLRVREPQLRGAFRVPVGVRGVTVLAAMPMLTLLLTMWLLFRGGELGATALVGALAATALGPVLYRVVTRTIGTHVA